MVEVSSINFESVVSSVQDGMYITDLSRRILYWNNAAEVITGFPASVVMGTSCRDNVLVHVDGEGNSLCVGGCPLSATMIDGKSREAEVYLHHRQGHRVPVLVRVSPLRDPEGKIIGGVELFTNRSPGEFLWERIQVAQRLALIDPSTELPNRKYLNQQILVQLAQLERFDLPFGMVSITVEGVSQLAERLGEDETLRILRTMASTMRNNVRTYDFIASPVQGEFYCLFPNVDAPVLDLFGKRFMSLLRTSDIPALDLVMRNTMAQSGDTVVSLLERLDVQ